MFFFVSVDWKHSCLSMSMILFAILCMALSLCLSTCLRQFHVNLFFNSSNNTRCMCVIV